LSRVAEAPTEERAGKDSPLLDPHEKEQAAAHATPKGLVIHEVLREEGETELKRTPGALFWSGLGGGLSMGFSLLALGFLRAGLADERWGGVASSVGYSVGFVICILGKQQLFTETTLTASLPLLLRRDAKTFGALLRMWAIVLASNLLGTLIFAWIIAHGVVFPPSTERALVDIGVEIVSGPALQTLLRAVLAGWLIALMVWMLPGSQSQRVFVIILMTSLVALGHFPHIVAGSTDAAYAVFSGHASVGDYLFAFLAPTLVGNVIGGVALAAILNHAPVLHDLAADGRG
jgi:formate/nitrite transporter FocA (FNT family)